MESGVKMMIRENKKIIRLIQKELIKKIICFYILFVILLNSFALSSSAQTELKIPAPKVKDDSSGSGGSTTEVKDTSSSTRDTTTSTKDTSSSTSDNTKTTKDTSSSTSDDTKTTKDTSSINNNSTSIKNATDDKYIDSAVDWLSNNYDKDKDVTNIETKKIEIKVEKEIGNISVGEKVIVKPEKSEEISIKTLEFVSSTDLEKVKFAVEKLDDKPEEILEEPKVNGTVYVYLDIKITSNDTYLHEEEFEYLKFEFKVEKTWIDENNIDKESVILIRYHDGWQHLNTTLLSEDDIYIYYESETPGLSTYTVVGTQIIEASPALIKEKSVMPISGWIAIISITSMVLIAVVYKLRFVYKSD